MNYNSCINLTGLTGFLFLRIYTDDINSQYYTSVFHKMSNN